MSISKERREEMKQAIADEDVLLDECVDETGSISPPGMTYGELQSLLDMADERDRYRILLREAHVELKHARVFISSREEMHPTGVEINDELVARIDAALEGKNNG